MHLHCLSLATMFLFEGIGVVHYHLSKINKVFNGERRWWTYLLFFSLRAIVFVLWHVRKKRTKRRI